MLVAAFWPFAIAFSVWMFIDCVLHDAKDKIFWSIMIIGTGPIGAALYASKRHRLVGVSETTYSNPDGTITTTVTRQDTNTPTGQIIRGLGVTLGVIMSVFGLLAAGFFILLMIMFSSGGGSEGGGK